MMKPAVKATLEYPLRVVYTPRSAVA